MVSVKGASFDQRAVLHRVPQGSILGPWALSSECLHEIVTNTVSFEEAWDSEVALLLPACGIPRSY